MSRFPLAYGLLRTRGPRAACILWGLFLSDATAMANDLTPSEVRFVRALCNSGPLGIAPLGIARALSVTTSTVGNLSAEVERKGFCIRERFGMRVFLKPTGAALAFVASNPTGAVESGAARPAPKRLRTPRAPGAR